MQDLASTEPTFTLELANGSVPIASTLDALRRYAAVNTLASPRVLALTNITSHIDVTTEVPYIQATTTTDVATGAVGTSTTQQVAFKEVGIRLEVTPTVQAGGVVLLSLVQELSEVRDFFQGIPVVDAREMQTSFLVQDGRTIVLGGLLENRVVETDSGVPLLMDLPFVGRLFRSDDDRGERRELLLFVTPRVLDPERAAELAGRVRSDYRARVERSGAPIGGGF
jgi:general secretion pathway protein D